MIEYLPLSGIHDPFIDRYTPDVDIAFSCKADNVEKTTTCPTPYGRYHREPARAQPKFLDVSAELVTLLEKRDRGTE